MWRDDFKSIVATLIKTNGSDSDNGSSVIYFTGSAVSNVSHSRGTKFDE